VTTKRRGQITNLLRQRTVRALQTGTLSGGERLPSTRTIAAELDVDPRVVLSAYRELAAEGLVELRERSGVYLAENSTASGNAPGMAERWIVDIFAQGITREVSPATLLEWMQRSLTTRVLRAGVVAASADQLLGICRELEADYGFETDSLVPGPGGAIPESPFPELEAVDLVVTTPACESLALTAAERVGAPVTIVDVRNDLVGIEWLDLLRNPVYVVATDVSFIALLRGFFANTPGAHNLRPVLLGRDSLSSIPAGATTYITQSARERLGDTPVPGRVVPPARVFSAESVRELLTFVVRKNWEALRRSSAVVAPDDEPPDDDL
jgi:DNA-binding transcriptional regulator YhcF (GntR family)